MAGISSDHDWLRFVFLFLNLRKQYIIMKFISSIIILFFFSFSNGQSFEKTQKIVFHYKKGHYNFLKKGNYGVEEIIEFEKNSKNIFEAKKITQIKN